MKQAEKTLKAIYENKIITIVRSIAVDLIVPTVKALVYGGIRFIEITFDQSSATGIEDTSLAIKSLSALFGEDVYIGAGTVATEAQLYAAYEAGAKYIISPHTNIELIQNTKKLGLISIPGCLTPSEIFSAYEAGADIIKLFPAGILGIPYIKAIRAPISHIPMAVVGGIDENNIKDFYNAGIKVFGIGSNIVKESLINAGRFDELTELAKLFVSKLN